jgi:flagellar hook-associated protein 3 FlgL
MRVTQRMMVEQLQRNINYNTENLGKLQDQLSSGKRLRRPSDDPPALSQAMRLTVTGDEDVQYLRNIDSAKGWLSATDSALQQLSSVLTRARDIALRGGSDTNGPEERKQLAQQVDSMVKEALQSVNSTHEENYIFAGQQSSGTTPFEISATGVVSYLGTPPGPVLPGGSTAMVREIDTGVPIDVSIAGDKTIGGDPVLASSLKSLYDLKAHLEANDTAQLGNDLDNITKSVSNVLSLRGVTGASLNRVGATEKAIKSAQTENAALLSRAQDADVAEVMTKLMNQESVYKAALSAGARAIQPSLLDYLR